MEATVTEIRVMAGDLIDHIEFFFSNGSKRQFGKRGGRLRQPFRLEAGEKLVAITSRCGDSQDGCSFTTSTGRTSEWFGSHGGQQRVLRVRPGHHIVGLQMAPGGITQRVLGIIEVSEEVAPIEAPEELAADVDVPVQRRVLSVQGTLRRTLHAFLPGDEVCLHDGHVGTVRDVHEDRTISVAAMHGTETWRPLLRDVTLKSPVDAGFPHVVTVRDRVVMVSWSGHCEMDAMGRCLFNGRRSAHDDREGVHFKKLVATSAPMPQGVRVICVALSCNGMDQGWGNTGEAGVHVSAKSPGDAMGDERVLIGAVFDRRRSRGQQHSARIEVAGAAGPQPGDVLQVWLKCPNYPGWSANCSSAIVTIFFERDEHRQGLGNPYPEALRAISEISKDEKVSEDDPLCLDTAALRLLWDRLGDDKFLAIDTSHLSLSGLRRQEAWTDPKQEAVVSTKGEPKQPVQPRIASLLREMPGDSRALASAEKLVRRLEQNDPVAGAPQEAAARRARYDQVLRIVIRTLDGLSAGSVDKRPPPLAEQVLVAYSDAEPHCLYRWEREIHMCHDLVCGDDSPLMSIEAKPLEDVVLRILHGKRRRIAEAALHRAKGEAGNNDMHFDSYFYANVHFGVLEQRDALLDPNRLTYAQLGTGLDFPKIQHELMSKYTPADIRTIIREDLVESKAEGAETMRSKLYDTLRAAMPAGFRPSMDSIAARQEAWLFEQCHDESYKIRDAALNFLLCRLHILSSSRVADLFRAAAAAAPSKSSSNPAPGARVRFCNLQAKPELNGQEGIILGRRVGTEGLERWEVQLETGNSISVRAANFEVQLQSMDSQGSASVGSSSSAGDVQGGRGAAGGCALQ